MKLDTHSLKAQSNETVQMSSKSFQRIQIFIVEDKTINSIDTLKAWEIKISSY